MSIRGAALAETSIVLGVGLTLLWGAFEIGVVGFNQTMGDGAAFIAGHRAALGDANANQAAQRAFDQLGNATVATSTVNPDTTTVGVNYGFDANARHGGLSLVRPQHLQTTVTGSQLGGVVLGQSATVQISGAQIEPKLVMTNDGFNLETADYNSSTAYANTINYFAADENVAPYLIGFRFMDYCVDKQWQTSCSNREFLSVSTAEYLDHDNWGKTPGAGPNQAFEEMTYHQQVYAQLAQAMDAYAQANPAAPRPTPDPSGNPPVMFDENNPSSPICAPYTKWDVATPYNYPLGVKTVGSNPFHGMSSC